MIPKEFDYERPSSLQAALTAIEQLGGRGKFLSGGHSLLPMMKLRLAAPEVLVDINTLPELHGIKVGATWVEIGAATTHAQLEHHKELGDAIPLFPEVAHVIADPTVRNRGTIGGSLAHADPSADWPSTMLALDALIDVQGPAGSRTLPAAEFFRGLFETDIAPDEILVKVRVPVVSGIRCAYRKFRHPASGYAVVGVAAVLEMSGDMCIRARLAVTGYGPHAFRARAAEALLAGQDSRSITNLDEVAAAVFQDMEPLQDRFADAEYRLQLGRTMARRAILAAAQG